MIATETLVADARQALRENLVVRRAKTRLSQAELAKRAGVSRPVIIRLEQGSGNVTLDSLARIAAALSCTVVELLEPWVPARENDAEIARRATTPPDDFLDADALLAAIDDATGKRETRRRTTVARRAPSRGR